jgi:sugar phosphate isomerase/epimerase
VNLRLACADFTFPLLPHTQVLKLISMLGFEGVDIGLFEGRTHIQPSHVSDNLPAQAKKLSAEVRGEGLEFADIFYQASDFRVTAANDPDPKERQKSRELFQKMLEFTLRCNGPHMTSLPGVEWDGVPHDTSLQRCSEELAWRVEQARQVGVVYSVEAHVGSIVPSPAEARRLLDMTPGLTLTLDYTHFIKIGMSDDDCEALIPFASHFHARGGKLDRIQAAMKENVIDYERVIHAMQRANYPGYVGVENVWQEWEHCDEVDNVSETILMRDRLRAAAANGGGQ